MIKPRGNIKKLRPYTSARDLVKEEDLIFLDANENPFDSGINRYPDPHQQELKNALADKLSVDTSQIFVGNGSDEVIDLVIRAYAEPGKDRIITLGPTYSMYEVQAAIQNVEVKEIPLEENFQPNPEKVMSEVTDRDKILFICSPNNPTGNLIKREKIISLLERFNGLVFVDEAYVEFSSKGSVLDLVEKYDNLLVSRTFSKAWGMAGIRLGMGVAQEEIVQTLTKIKYPYNVNRLTQQAAMDALKSPARSEQQISTLLTERAKLKDGLSGFSFVKTVYPSDANFLLLEVSNAASLIDFLKKKGIVIRNRSGVIAGKKMVRITVGTPDQNKKLMFELKSFDNG